MTNAPDPVPPRAPSRPARRDRGEGWTEERGERLRVVLILAALLALAFAAAWLMTAERRATRRGADELPPEAVAGLLERSKQLEREFEEARVRRAVPTEEDIALLAAALAAQEEYVSARRAVGADTVRTEQLRRKLHLLHADRLRTLSDAAEQRARAALRDDPAAAFKDLVAALAAEQEISERWHFSGLADPGRIARLRTRVRTMETEPLARLGRQLEAEGRALLAVRGSHEAAAEKFAAALAQERDLEERYRDVRTPEYGRITTLEALRETALGRPFALAAEEAAEAARQAEKAGDWPAAARAWDLAGERLARLQSEHPRSADAAPALRAETSRRAAAARYHDRINAVREGQAVARSALKAGRTDDALRAMEPLVPEMARLAEAGTGLFTAEDAERQEAEFILARRVQLGPVHRLLEGGLRPLPGVPPRRMLTGEVSQELHLAVTGENPSAVRAAGAAVDSVTFDEAESMCRRLGWMLGRRVRLAAAEDYQAAAADPAFRGLLDGPDEWGRAPAAALPDRATVFGPAAAGGVAARTVHRRERSRSLGYRIVVEE